MRFDGGRNGCRAAKQSWWNMLLAAAGMQKSRPGSCWRQVQVGPQPCHAEVAVHPAGSGASAALHPRFMARAGLTGCMQSSRSAICW